MAIGQLDWSPLDSEWNVTPTSPTRDDAVILWHYNDGSELTRSLKRNLHRPDRTGELLAELAGRWPRQAERLAELRAAAVQALRLANEPQEVASTGAASKSAAPIQRRAPASKRCLLAACSSGLCNRMLGIAGSLRMAELTNREFLLYWPANDHAGCAFEHLFTNQFRMFRERDMHYLLATNVTVRVYNAWKTKTPHYTDMATDGDPDAEIVLVKPWSYPKFSHEFFDEALRRVARPYLRSLQPKPGLLAEANTFPLPKPCVGVHVRRADKSEEFARSKDEDFCRIIEALLERHPALRFFLATDDPGTETKFRRLFRDRVVVFPKHGRGRREPRGMEEALIDLLLLSRTRAILGNHFSSYTHAAGALEGKPVVIAEERTAHRDLAETLEVFDRALLAE
jgi:hypothetical protein